MPLHYNYESDWDTPLSVVVAGAEWADDFTLVMIWQFAESAFRDTMKCQFNTSGDQPSVKISRNVSRNSHSLPSQMITIDGIAE